ncbi:lipid kinase [Phenylobacterium sp. J367]|uniref:lipid kinase n=1 Tax=Phenylobacterium sp. J367 TaxID=2898435 RepID=UPI002151E948|nr:lipid kinase [Phenylobacterium sp. J367]MCR5877236.1 lipid kinase [Phenylobacterium sp. J367]
MSPPPRRALLIRNEAKGADWLAAVRDRLGEAGITVIDTPTGDVEAACAAIAETSADLILVAGGDGTLNGVAPALLEAGKPVGVLPLGTANDLARTLGLPTGIEAAAEVIAAGRTRRIDVGLANGRPFFNVASIGLAAKLAQTLGEGAKHRFGRLSYALAALRVLLGAETFRAAIAADGQALRTRSYQVAVGNGRYHGGGAAVTDEAEIDSGRLALYSLEPGSLWKLVLLAPLFRRGRHVRWREVRTASAREVEIRTPSPMPVNLDGELATETPLALTIRPGALEVFAPT